MPGLALEETEMKLTSRTLRTIVAGVALVGATAVLALAAPEPQSPTDRFKNLEFREIGPAVMVGRIDDFAAVESNPNIVYVGTASGGVWKTTNNGGCAHVDDVRIALDHGEIIDAAESNPNIVYVGTASGGVDD